MEHRPIAAHLPLEKRVALYGEWISSIVAQAEREGVIVTIERRSLMPPAMGHHYAHVEAFVSKTAREAPTKPQLVVVAR